MKKFSDLTPSSMYGDWHASVQGYGKSNYKRCYETHPPLKIGEWEVYGGSCHSPIVPDADVYLGLDHSMKHSSKAYPWTEGFSFLYPITDMQAPSNPESFIKLIDFLSEQVRAGKKLHVGCMGGHGRTGLVLSALVKSIAGIDDAISYVRQHYCSKAVETSEQVVFLNKHFGISKAKGTKQYTQYKSVSSGYSLDSSTINPKNSSKGSVWGKNFRLTIV